MTFDKENNQLKNDNQELMKLLEFQGELMKKQSIELEKFHDDQVKKQSPSEASSSRYKRPKSTQKQESTKD